MKNPRDGGECRDSWTTRRENSRCQPDPQSDVEPKTGRDRAITKIFKIPLVAAELTEDFW